MIMGMDTHITAPALAGPPVGAAAVPDSAGLNLFRADPWLAPLLSLYLPPDLLAHLAPHLDRMGALAGGGWTRWPPPRIATRPSCCTATGAARMRSHRLPPGLP